MQSINEMLCTSYCSYVGFFASVDTVKGLRAIRVVCCYYCYGISPVVVPEVSIVY